MSGRWVFLYVSTKQLRILVKIHKITAKVVFPLSLSLLRMAGGAGPGAYNIVSGGGCRLGVPHAEIQIEVVAVIEAFAFTCGLHLSTMKIGETEPPCGTVGGS